MNGVSRFLSRREKKHKPVVKSDITKDIYHLFHCEEKKTLTRSEEKTLNNNIQEVTKKLEALNVTCFKEPHIEYALRSQVTNGVVDKAVSYLCLFRDTINGEIKPIDPTVKMTGAINREMVTCYIDSLLFAMFARLDSFESIVYLSYPDPATNTLAILLRFWVNMLRTGRLITTDITKHLQEALADCGWEAAKKLAQQDVSEAFTFITDRLALPLLTLKMDVYHTGKDDTDDHRLVKERLLDVAIPPPPEDGGSVRLEDCLEKYFNNKIEVKRHLQRRNTLNSTKRERVQFSSTDDLDLTLAQARNDSWSIFRHRKLEESIAIETKDDIDVRLGPKPPRPATLKKEVLMPAWQFFHLIPWIETKQTQEALPTTDAQVASHFAQKNPMLGICLKRYSVSNDGVAKRLSTHIDIPLEIRLPHFIADGSGDDGWGSSFSRFKLSLQSVICHRGASIEGGHYVALVRPSYNEQVPKCDPETDAKYQWILFDDLAKDERVKHIDIRKALKDEVPYLVFYQVQLVDELGAIKFAQETLPSYAEATLAGNSSSNLSGTTYQTPNHTAPASMTSSAPGTINSTPLVKPTVNGIPTDIDTLIMPRNATLENISHGASVPELGVAVFDALQPTSSAPPAVDSGARPHSLELPKSMQGRTSQDSDRQTKRLSVTFTDSTSASQPITPFEDVNQKAEDYVSVIPASELTSPNSSIMGRKEKRRGREKEKDDEKAERRRSSRNWLSVGGGSVRKRDARPVSQPPNGENRKSIVVGNFVKGLKDVLGRDTKDGEEAAPVPSITDAAAIDSNANPTPVKDKDESGKGKEKEKGTGLGRKKSARKSKGKQRDISPSGALNGNSEGPERQCRLM